MEIQTNFPWYALGRGTSSISNANEENTMGTVWTWW